MVLITSTISIACRKLYLNTGFTLDTIVIIIMFLLFEVESLIFLIFVTWQRVNSHTLMCILALFSKLSVVCLVLSGPKGTSFFSCSRYSRNLARLQTHKHRPRSADIHQRVGTFAQRRSAASPEGLRGGGSRFTPESCSSAAVGNKEGSIANGD